MLTRASIFPVFRIKVKPYKLFLFLSYNLNNLQVSFRQLLTMLAVFDCVFITTVSVSFSLPQLSTYWKVASLKHMKSVIISNGIKTNSFFKPRSGSIQGSFLGCFLSYRSPSLDLLGKTSTLAITIELELIFLLHTSNRMQKMSNQRSTVSVTVERFLSVVHPRCWWVTNIHFHRVIHFYHSYTSLILVS